MKGRKTRATGGNVSNVKSGNANWDDDVSKKNMRYTANSNVNDEAEERKNGGKAGKKNMARKPRKSGGRAGSESSPFTSARGASAPKAHKPLEIR